MCFRLQHSRGKCNDCTHKRHQTRELVCATLMWIFLNTVLDTYLFLLFIKIVDDHSNEEIESEEGTHDDKKYKVDVHVNVHFILRLLLFLK